MAKQNDKETDPILNELTAIKRLLMLQLYKARATQTEIAIALGIDPSAVSRMLPAKKIKVTNA